MSDLTKDVTAVADVDMLSSPKTRCAVMHVTDSHLFLPHFSFHQISCYCSWEKDVLSFTMLIKSSSYSCMTVEAIALPSHKNTQK